MAKRKLASLQKAYTDIWNRFQRNHFSSHKIQNYLTPPIHISIRRLGYWSARCQNSILIWRVRWRNIYGTTQRFHSKGLREESLLLTQGHLWFKTSHSTMEQGITWILTQNRIHSYFCQSWCLYSFPGSGSYHLSHLCWWCAIHGI